VKESISEKAKSVLKDMGLTEYETRAYLYLLSSGLSTASQLSENANIPYSKVYEILNSLERKGWIKSQENRPRLYYPKSPREALIETTLQIENKIKDWRKTILYELQPIYEKRGIREKPDIWIFRSELDAIAKLKEMISNAQKEILIAMPKIAFPLIRAVLPMLRDIDTSKVKMLIMVPSDGDNLSSDFRLLGDVRFKDEMFGGGVIVDGREVTLILGESKPSIMLWSNHIDLVRFAKDYFQHIWESASES